MMTREKIIPEDLIQKTNLQQHNFMIAAINEIDERQKDVEDSNAATTAAVATLKSDVVSLSEKHDDDIADLEQDIAAVPDVVRPIIIDSLDTHLKGVLIDDDMLRFSADKKAIFLQKNRRDGVTVDELIPISTRQNVGLAAPEDLQAIDGLTSRVTTLENSGITGELFYLNHNFSGITDAVRTVHFNADIGKPPVTGDSVIDNQQKSWRYVITGPATFGWVEVPHLSIGGDLKAVKSSDADGKVYVENDNTCSVVGWNSVKNDISGNTTAIAGHAGNTANPHGVTKVQVGLGAYPASPADIGISTATQTALNAKQDKLTFDSEPVAGSDNPVKSGGIYDALDRLMNLLLPPIDCAVLLTLYKGDTAVKQTPFINATGCATMKEMFSGCTNLRWVMPILTPSVTDMEKMFQGCSSLTSVPEMDTGSVTIMFHMFYGCSSLTSVTFTGNVVPPYGSNMFRSTPIAAGNGTIYVPDGMVSVYKTASGWSAHASVIKGISEKP